MAQLPGLRYKIESAAYGRVSALIFILIFLVVQSPSIKARRKIVVSSSFTANKCNNHTNLTFCHHDIVVKKSFQELTHSQDRSLAKRLPLEENVCVCVCVDCC